MSSSNSADFANLFRDRYNMDAPTRPDRIGSTPETRTRAAELIAGLDPVRDADEIRTRLLVDIRDNERLLREGNLSANEISVIEKEIRADQRELRKSQARARRSATADGSTSRRRFQDEEAQRNAASSAALLQELIERKQSDLEARAVSDPNPIALQPLENEIADLRRQLSDLDRDTVITRGDVGELPDSRGRFRDGTISQLRDPNENEIGWMQDALQSWENAEERETAGVDLIPSNRNLRLGDRGRPDLRTEAGVREFDELVLRKERNIESARARETIIRDLLAENIYDPVGYEETINNSGARRSSFGRGAGDSLPDETLPVMPSGQRSSGVQLGNTKYESNRYWDRQGGPSVSGEITYPQITREEAALAQRELNSEVQRLNNEMKAASSSYDAKSYMALREQLKKVNQQKDDLRALVASATVLANPRDDFRRGNLIVNDGADFSNFVVNDPTIQEDGSRPSIRRYDEQFRPQRNGSTSGVRRFNRSADPVTYRFFDNERTDRVTRETFDESAGRQELMEESRRRDGDAPTASTAVGLGRDPIVALESAVANGDLELDTPYQKLGGRTPRQAIDRLRRSQPAQFDRVEVRNADGTTELRDVPRNQGPLAERRASEADVQILREGADRRARGIYTDEELEQQAMRRAGLEDDSLSYMIQRPDGEFVRVPGVRSRSIKADDTALIRAERDRLNPPTTGSQGFLKYPIAPQGDGESPEYRALLQQAPYIGNIDESQGVKFVDRPGPYIDRSRTPGLVEETPGEQRRSLISLMRDERDRRQSAEYDPIRSQIKRRRDANKLAKSGRGQGTPFVTNRTPEQEQGTSTFVDRNMSRVPLVDVLPQQSQGTFIASPMGAERINGRLIGDRAFVLPTPTSEESVARLPEGRYFEPFQGPRQRERMFMAPETIDARALGSAKSRDLLQESLGIGAAGEAAESMLPTTLKGPGLTIGDARPVFLPEGMDGTYGNAAPQLIINPRTGETVADRYLSEVEPISIPGISDERKAVELERLGTISSLSVNSNSTSRIKTVAENLSANAQDSLRGVGIGAAFENFTNRLSNNKEFREGVAAGRIAPLPAGGIRSYADFSAAMDSFASVAKPRFSDAEQSGLRRPRSATTEELLGDLKFRRNSRETIELASALEQSGLATQSARRINEVAVPFNFNRTSVRPQDLTQPMFGPLTVSEPGGTPSALIRQQRFNTAGVPIYSMGSEEPYQRMSDRGGLAAADVSLYKGRFNQLVDELQQEGMSLFEARNEANARGLLSNPTAAQLVSRLDPIASSQARIAALQADRRVPGPGDLPGNIDSEVMDPRALAAEMDNLYRMRNEEPAFVLEQVNNSLQGLSTDLSFDPGRRKGDAPIDPSNLTFSEAAYVRKSLGIPEGRRDVSLSAGLPVSGVGRSLFNETGVDFRDRSFNADRPYDGRVFSKSDLDVRREKAKRSRGANSNEPTGRQTQGVVSNLTPSELQMLRGSSDGTRAVPVSVEDERRERARLGGPALLAAQQTQEMPLGTDRSVIIPRQYIRESGYMSDRPLADGRNTGGVLTDADLTSGLTRFGNRTFSPVSTGSNVNLGEPVSSNAAYQAYGPGSGPITIGRNDGSYTPAAVLQGASERAAALTNGVSLSEQNVQSFNASNQARFEAEQAQRLRMGLESPAATRARGVATSQAASNPAAQFSNDQAILGSASAQARVDLPANSPTGSPDARSFGTRELNMPAPPTTAVERNFEQPGEVFNPEPPATADDKIQREATKRGTPKSQATQKTKKSAKKNLSQSRFDRMMQTARNNPRRTGAGIALGVGATAAFASSISEEKRRREEEESQMAMLR